MRRAAISTLVVVAWAAVGRPLGAQRVPGRDLLDFPLGTLAEAPALATSSGIGIANPATFWVPRGHLAKMSLVAVQTPAEIGVTVAGVGAAVALPLNLTASMSAVRGAVDGIARTTVDPETAAGGDIPYATTLYSAGLARQHQRVIVGLALRFRTGTVDDHRRSALGVDAGVIADTILSLPLRAALSTFLWRPANGGDEETAYAGALDGRIAGRDSTLEVRGGYGLTLVERRTVEHYLFTGGSSGPWDGRVGLLRHDSSGESEWTMRLGIGVRYGRYHVGVARDGFRDAIGGIYQFTLTTLVR